MIYYKDTNNKPFVFEDNVTAEIIAKVEATHKTTLTKITTVDYKALIAPTFAELQAAKQQTIKGDLQTHLKSYTLADGTIIRNSLQDQSNNLKNIALSQQALTSPKWTASVDVALNDVVFIGDTLCLCTTAGKTDSSAPTAPTVFGKTVTDNTAVWKKLGFLVNTGKGRVYYTPQDILRISQEVALILNEALTKYDNLKAQIETCTTEPELTKITW